MISEIQRQTRPVMHALWCTTVSLDLKSEATARLKKKVSTSSSSSSSSSKRLTPQKSLFKLSIIYILKKSQIEALKEKCFRL